jgi:hypothetical protein
MKNTTKRAPSAALDRAEKIASKQAAEKAKQKAEKEAKEAAELAELYKDVTNPKPHLDCRIFPLPEYCSVSSIAMRELDGEDDKVSAFWADQHATTLEEQSANAASIADQREGMRISLVGVDGLQVNEDGVPYMDCDEWTSKTWRFVMQCFSEMNGVPMDDLKNAVRRSIRAGGVSQSANASADDGAPAEG